METAVLEAPNEGGAMSRNLKLRIKVEFVETEQDASPDRCPEETQGDAGSPVRIRV
jgi:hypothetical protein